MTPTKLYLSITLLTLLLLLNSCKKEQQSHQIVKNHWKRSKADRIETDKYIDAGYSLLHKLNYDSSYYYYSKAKFAAETKKDTSRIILSLINLADILYIQADYAGAETTATEIIPLLEKKKNHPYNFDLNLTMGNISKSTLDYKNALSYYNKALRLKKTTSDEKVKILHNIARIYIEMKKFKTACYMLEYLIKNKESSNNVEAYTLILTNLGFCYFELDNPKALDYLFKSLKITSKTDNISKV